MSSQVESPEIMPEPVRSAFGQAEVALTSCESRIEAVNRGPEGRQFAESLERRLRRERSRVLSLDIFDTLLLRNDVCEARRYLDLSIRISQALAAAHLGEISPLDLYITRCEALEFGYRTSAPVEGCVEGRIEEVLANQVRNLGLPGTAMDILLREEISYESSVLAPNLPLIEVARNFSLDGGTVILLSDMYLSGIVLGHLIQSVAGDLSFVERLYSSADVVRNKRSGTIYPWLQAQLEIHADRFLHVGDNLVSDYQRPIEAGWKAMHFPVSKAELIRRQQSLCHFLAEMDGEGLDFSRWAKM